MNFRWLIIIVLCFVIAYSIVFRTNPSAVIPCEQEPTHDWSSAVCATLVHNETEYYQDVMRCKELNGEWRFNLIGERDCCVNMKIIPENATITTIIACLVDFNETTCRGGKWIEEGNCCQVVVIPNQWIIGNFTGVK